MGLRSCSPYSFVFLGDIYTPKKRARAHLPYQLYKSLCHERKKIREQLEEIEHNGNE